MPSKKRTRDNRHTRTFGEKPRTGRRYVSNGKVKIEWHEEGKRRSRTIGENTPEVRRRADEALQEILEVFEPAAVPARRSLTVPPESMEQAVRALAVSLLDVADQIAESAMTAGSDLVQRIRRSRAAPEAEQQDEQPDEGVSPEE
ncbi:MAG: hypothetical protein JSW71_15270 [Gemmatimonadota bacterium]|nr:MAG: hypothetical protein JSW71_15270 [Gemmatimonadota bacterium]